LKRAVKTGRYPALRGDIYNPHKKAQRIRDLHQRQDEVTATLRAKNTSKKSGKTHKRTKSHKKAYKRVIKHGYRKESLTCAIAQEGERLLVEIVPKESEQKSRRTLSWKLFRGLAGSVVDRIMTKVAALQTTFYLRFSYTYQLRNTENGKVMLYHKNLGGSTTPLTTHAAAREWMHEKIPIDWTQSVKKQSGSFSAGFRSK